MISVRAAILILTILFAWTACLKIRQRSVFFQVLLVLLGAAFFMEVAGIITNRMDISNVAAYNLFFFLDAMCFLFLAHRSRYVPRILLIGTGVLITVAMLFSAHVNNISDGLLSEGILISGGSNSILSLLIMYRVAANEQTPLLRIPQFWFFLSALIYFGGILPFIGAEQSAHNLDHKWATMMYSLVVVSAIIRYLLIGYSCILEQRKQRLHGIT